MTDIDDLQDFHEHQHVDDIEDEDVLVAQAIPYDQWVEFFDRFTRRHAGESVFVEAGASTRDGNVETPVETIASDLPLQGIVADLKDDAPGTIEIILGGDAEDHMAHVIQQPSFVYLYQDDQGEDEVIEIESADGPATLIHF
jgi:hypothetical protein